MKDAKGHGSDAHGTLKKLGIPLGADFHTLNSSKVQGLVDEAKTVGYRKPDNANGSTGRYFHDKLQREAARTSSGQDTRAASQLASGPKSSAAPVHDSMRVPDDGKPGGVGPGGTRSAFSLDPNDPRVGSRDYDAMGNPRADKSAYDEYSRDLAYRSRQGNGGIGSGGSPRAPSTGPGKKR